MVRATDFLKRHFEVPYARATKMTYTSGALQSITRKTNQPRVQTKKEKLNDAERPEFSQ